MILANILGLLFLLLFFSVLFYYVKKGGFKRGLKDFLFFSLPIIILFSFIEFFWVYRGEGRYNPNISLFFFKGVPLVMPLAWVVVIFFAMQLTKKTFGKNKIIKRENFLLAISDGFWAVLFDVLLLEPLAFKLNFWYHKSTYLIFGAPLWNFIGWFLGAFLISFILRISRRLKEKQRVLFLLFIILIIITGRIVVFKIFSF